MPGFAALVAELNRRFHPSQINDFAKHADAFAPGKPLDPGLISQPGSPVQRRFSSYLEEVPPVLREAVRSVIHQALSSQPPTQLTFAWVPAYEFEMTISHAACGITVVFKSRYPNDKLPPPGSEAA